MCTTDRQVVCGAGPAFAAVLAADVAAGRMEPPRLATGAAAPPAAMASAGPVTAVWPAEAAGMAPASATVANTATYRDIARATQPRRAAVCRVPDRRCARHRPIAPCRIGSSMKRHDRAAAAMLAATCTAALARLGGPSAGVVSTMIGKCHR